MNAMRNIQALIPARAGSQRLPGKNVALVGGKPMIEWTIIAARQSKLFDNIVVTTNDVRVRDIARRYDLLIIDQPDYEQNDFAMPRVVRHALELHYSRHTMLLQPTSPLRTARHIVEAYELFDQSFPTDALVSVDPNKKVNGAIYLFTAARIWRARDNVIYDDHSIRYEMEFAASVDVDTQTDIDRVNAMLGDIRNDRLDPHR